VNGASGLPGFAFANRRVARFDARMPDWFAIVLLLILLVALGIVAGIRNNLAALTAEIKTLHKMLESGLRRLGADGRIEERLDPVAHLAVAQLREKSESLKCSECGALPVFQANYDDDSMGKEGEADTLGRFLFAGREGGGWRYTYHFENCSRREPGTAVITSPKHGKE